MILRLILVLLALGVFSYLGLTIIRVLAPVPDFSTHQPARLAACPDSPNCVCSQPAEASDGTNYMSPIPYEGTADAALERLKKLIDQDFPAATLVAQDGLWLRYEFVSAIVRFVDDVEFLADDETKQIHFRSASRVGYSDLGANRKRMQKLKAAFSP